MGVITLGSQYSCGRWVRKKLASLINSKLRLDFSIFNVIPGPLSALCCKSWFPGHPGELLQSRPQCQLKKRRSGVYFLLSQTHILSVCLKSYSCVWSQLDFPIPEPPGSGWESFRASVASLLRSRAFQPRHHPHLISPIPLLSLPHCLLCS